MIEHCGAKVQGRDGKREDAGTQAPDATTAHDLKTVASETDRWADAVKHLRRVDPRLREVIERIGPCRLAPRPDRFGTLVRAIVGQQISSKAAAVDRPAAARPRRRAAPPARLLELGEAALRSVGLSAVKARYVLNLAEAVVERLRPARRVRRSWDDDAIIAALTSIKGIGVWTAEMFLIFALNRPDVLPVARPGRPCRAARPPRPARAAQAPGMPGPGRALAAVPDRRQLVYLAEVDACEYARRQWQSLA